VLTEAGPWREEPTGLADVLAAEQWARARAAELLAASHG
jgi:1-deoxy-D-xylulose-5-phosphate reductoisomerase